MFAESYMHRCLDLALKGKGLVEPNPMVGCVIVHDGRIIGEGFHQQYGGPHAEVNAVNAISDASLISESTVYVSLEPCAHYGKTPPCAELLARLKPRKVVVAMRDPNPLVAGKGIQILLEAGIEVETGLLEAEARDLNRRFVVFHTQQRPYIILKWAQTLDGFMDIERKPGDLAQEYWITNKELKILVHRWRTEEQGIMVGKNTVINDNPQLTARLWEGRQPLPFIITSTSVLPSDAAVFAHPRRPVVFGHQPWQGRGNADFVLYENEFFDSLDLYCYKNKIASVMVEGGRYLLNSFIRSDRWDEARVLVGNRYFVRGLEAPVLPENKLKQRYKAGDNFWKLYQNE